MLSHTVSSAQLRPPEDSGFFEGQGQRPGLTPRGLAQRRRHTRLSWVPGDPSGHENWIVKNVSLETIHCIPRKTAPSPSPSPPCAIHSLNSGWELGSHSAHLLSISWEKRKKPLKTTNRKRWGRGREDPLQQACQLGAGVCRGLLRLEASFCSTTPFPVQGATRAGLSLVCGVG